MVGAARPASPCALAAGGALLAGGAVLPDSADANALLHAAFSVWAGGEGGDADADAPPLAAGTAAGRVVTAAAAVGAPGLATRLAKLVEAGGENEDDVALMEAVCALADSPAGRKVAASAGGAAAAGRAFDRWWGGDAEGQEEAPPGLLIGSARQRALDAVLALAAHADGLAALGGGRCGAAGAAARLRRTAARLWRAGGAAPRAAAVAAALTASTAAGATAAGLVDEAAAWARLPAAAVDAALAGGGDARAARQVVSAWAALAKAAPAALAGSPWAEAATRLLSSAPAVRQAGAGALAVAGALAQAGHVMGDLSALAAAAAAASVAAAVSDSRAAADAAADALDGLAGWVGGPLHEVAVTALAPAEKAALPAWAAGGFAAHAHPALAAAAARAAAALARHHHPSPSFPQPSVWLVALAKAVTDRVAGSEAATPADALSGAGEDAAAAALDAAATWFACGGVDKEALVEVTVACSAALADVSVDGASPQVRAARALAAAVRPHALAVGDLTPETFASWKEEEEDPVVGEDDDDLDSRLRGLDLGGEVVGGPDDCV